MWKEKTVPNDFKEEYTKIKVMEQTIAITETLRWYAQRVNYYKEVNTASIPTRGIISS